jgi:hypothetical protein
LLIRVSRTCLPPAHDEAEAITAQVYWRSAAESASQITPFLGL